jgi:hypothetical protein
MEASGEEYLASWPDGSVGGHDGSVPSGTAEAAHSAAVGSSSWPAKRTGCVHEPRRLKHCLYRDCMYLAPFTGGGRRCGQTNPNPRCEYRGLRLLVSELA